MKQKISSVYHLHILIVVCCILSGCGIPWKSSKKNVSMVHKNVESNIHGSLINQRSGMPKVSIIIPAYNEAKRLPNTLRTYCSYFHKLKYEKKLDFEIVVVLNGCTDNTKDVIKPLCCEDASVIILDLQEAGKGLAIAAGFKNALQRDATLIGFVDADMATRPEYFYALIQQCQDADGAIASRYIKGAQVYPERPFIKLWGRRLIYDNLVYLLFNMNYCDTQCGAKLFRRPVIQAIASDLSEKQWAFDVELLYLCKQQNFTIKEVPTVWYDQAESKLATFSSGMVMLQQLFAIRQHHAKRT